MSNRFLNQDEYFAQTREATKEGFKNYHLKKRTELTPEEKMKWLGELRAIIDAERIAQDTGLRIIRIKKPPHFSVDGLGVSPTATDDLANENWVYEGAHEIVVIAGDALEPDFSAITALIARGS